MVGAAKGSHLAHRTDIDGLRAVAVLAVILFHIKKSLVPGGFLGVDVFFVISGFLISRNVMQDLGSGRFSVAEFYRRRIRRIVPAMLLVVTTTFIAAYLLLLPEDAKANAKATVFALASIANVYCWRYLDTSYFAPASSQIPLLHLWSLGVEEQFYFVWPPVLMLLARRGRSLVGMVPWFVGAAAVSFALGDLLYSHDASFVYYMLPSRAGELLVGGVAAAITLKQGEVAPAWARWMALPGLAILTLTLVMITENQPFPGWRAAVPSVATALIILSGHWHRTGVARWLSHRVMIRVGLISYSAYLWHWPLLAFYRYGYGEPGLLAGAVIFVAILLLSWASHRFVEEPLRRSRASLRSVGLRFLLVPSSVLALLALTLLYRERLGLPLYPASYVARLGQLENQTRPAYELDWICQRQVLTPADLANPSCERGTDSTGRSPAILWGDSHAAHYAGMLDVFADARGFRLRNIEVGACPPLDIDPGPFTVPTRAADCRQSQKLVWPVVTQARVIVIATAWMGYGKEFLPAFFAMVERLEDMDKLVILIGEAPWIPGYDRQCAAKALRYPFAHCVTGGVPLLPEVVAVNAKLAEFASRHPGVRYFDANGYLCPDQQCSPISADGEPLYFDESHLSVDGSLRLGREILAQHGIPAAFQDIPGWLPHQYQH